MSTKIVLGPFDLKKLNTAIEAVKETRDKLVQARLDRSSRALKAQAVGRAFPLTLTMSCIWMNSDRWISCLSSAIQYTVVATT